MFHYFFKEKGMKRQLATTAAILGFAAVSAHAQMPGGTMGGHGGMGAPGQGMSVQQSQQMMGGQMMNQEMMRDLSGMMRQMNDMVQSMSRAIDQHPMMEQDRMRDMAKLMEDMSATMREMSQQMAQGRMNPAMTRRMEERAGQMNRMLEELKNERH